MGFRRFLFYDRKMGYDIYAYIPEEPPTDPMSVCAKEGSLGPAISFLEMGARSPDAKPLFEALGALEYDGEVSGIGIGRYFTRDQIDAALKRLCTDYVGGRASVRTLRFLAETMESLHSDREWVYIDFG